VFLCLHIACCFNAFSQKQKLKNQPYADQKLFHFGFTVGVNAQDIILSHSGAVSNRNEVWFSEVPSYSPGFSVGIIADRYINSHMNLRVIPSIHFGERRFAFREQNASSVDKDQDFPIKSNYLSLPIHMRFSSERLNNIRPYILAGGFINTEIGNKSEPIIKYKSLDYGIDIGIGCNLYFPLFKMSPELRFSFGLKDIIEHDRSDLRDQSLVKYTDAIQSGKSRMITLTFNFE
jgi:hypothetical protein